MADRRMSRRNFLSGVAAAGAVPALWPRDVSAQTGPPPPQNVRVVEGGTSTPPATSTGPKALLSSSDFTFLGTFQLPIDVDGFDATWGRGLAFRYVNGQLRFFATTIRQTVYEVAAPDLKTTLPYNMAPVVRHWGDISGAKRYNTQNDGVLYGLYWDPIDQRLYWSYGSEYNAQGADDPSVGYSMLNDSTGMATPVGAWRFSGRGCKATMGGVLPIPAWFSDAYCPGRRLGAGFGGYYSVATVGPIHMGPSLCTFAPPNISANADRSSLAFTELVGYPFNAAPYTQPDRGHRDPNYTTGYDGWNPLNGVGYWTWSDFIWQGAVWIDLPTKHGVAYFPTLGTGRQWYESSALRGDGHAHYVHLYDPQDMASVATGAKRQHEIQAAKTWPIQFPGLPYPLPGWKDEPVWMVQGTAFDATTNRLYVGVRFGAPTNVIPSSSHAIHVYQVG